MERKVLPDRSDEPRDIVETEVGCEELRDHLRDEGPLLDSIRREEKIAMTWEKECPNCGHSSYTMFAHGRCPACKQAEQVSSESPAEHGTRAQSVPPISAAELKKLTDDLVAPPAKFWIDKKKILKELATMGEAAAAALPVVADHMMYVVSNQKRMLHLDVLRAVGRADPDLVQQLISCLDKGCSSSDRACAALALGALGRSAQDAIPDLRECLEARGWLGPKEDVRAAAAIALYQLGHLSRDETYRYLAEFLQMYKSDDLDTMPPVPYVRSSIERL